MASLGRVVKAPVDFRHDVADWVLAMPVAAALSDLTHATQQARALSREVDHVIAAAGEIREVLGDAPPPKASTPL